MLNWTAEDYEWTIPEDIYLGGAVLMIGNYNVKEGPVPQPLCLRPYEARIYTLRR